MLESNFKKQNYTVIGIASLIEGDLTLSGDVIIHSHIKGTITIKAPGKVTLERASHLEGTINCEDIDVFGKVEGNINSTGTLTVRSSANVSGTIKSGQLTVYPGAILNMEAHAEEL
jgi:cytoskeletal protein CcmA (bactofilin family)